MSNQINTLVVGTGTPNSYTGGALTGSTVYSAQTLLIDNSQLDILIVYAPGSTGASIKLNVTVQVSPDPLDTSAANSKWIDVGTFANASGTLTFTASTVKLVSTGQLTADWTFSTQAKKFKVGVSEEGSPGTPGTALIWAFQKMES